MAYQCYTVSNKFRLEVYSDKLTHRLHYSMNNVPIDDGTTKVHDGYIAVLSLPV